jgi:site-specific DNA recombinase
MKRATLGLPSSVEPALKSAAIYCRVSSPKQANRSDGGTADDFTKDKVSIPEQKRACLEKAQERGFTVADSAIFVEVWTAADFFERPKLSDLRDQIRAKQFKALIVYCVDRINRHIGHLTILVDECKRAGCELIFVLDKIDDTPEGQMMLYLKGCIAQAERENIRRRTIMGKHSRALNGKVANAGSEKYGWVRENGTRKKHPEQAAVVELIYRLAAHKRMGQFAIARYLNERGIPPPGAGRKFRDGRIPLWHQKSVRVILADPEYKGEAVAWKYVSKGTGKNKRTVPRDKDQWIKLPDGVVEPIVSPDLWVRAQNVRIEYVKRYGREDGPSKHKPDALLRSFAFCPDCAKRGNSKARMYVVGMGTPQHPYIYRCKSNYSRVSDTIEKCKAKSLSIKKADKLVWDVVSQVLLKPELLKPAIEKQNGGGGPSPKLLQDIEVCGRQIEEIQKGQARYVKQLGTASDDLVELIEKELAILNDRKKAVADELARLQATYNAQVAKTVDYRLVINFLERAANNIQNLDHEGHVRLLSALGLRVLINGKNNVTVQMLFDPESSRFMDELLEGYVTVYSGKVDGTPHTNSIRPSNRSPDFSAEFATWVLRVPSINMILTAIASGEGSRHECQ